MFLDWDGARRLLRPGVAIGSHSQHHSILSQEDAADQAADLAQSRQELERRLGVEVALLAYPNGRDGDYDQATVAAARQAGYGHAITTLPGWNGPATPPYEIRRFVQQPERGVPGLAIVPLYPVRRRIPLGSWRTVERLTGAARRRG